MKRAAKTRVSILFSVQRIVSRCCVVRVYMSNIEELKRMLVLYVCQYQL